MIKKLVFSLLIALFALTNLTGQDELDNIFLSRDFWKTGPDVAQIKTKIAEGNDPVVLNASAFDAICYAILEDAPLASLEYLLSLPGNEVTKNTHDGRNYLLWAGYKGNIPLLDLLIKKGSDTKLVDDHGYNLLAFTAVGGQLDTKLYDLIFANAGKVEDTNRSGANALMLLVPKLDGTELIEYFVDKGLALDATDSADNNIFAYAARVGNRYLMDYLISKGIDYKKTNNEGGNAMLWAAGGYRRTTNGLPVFHYLDSLGIKANVVTTSGETPLHAMAYRQKDSSVYAFFLDKGVAPDQVNEDGNTPFINAARTDNVIALKLLQPLIKNINHQNKEGFSALTYATRRYAQETVEMLVAAGADVQVVDGENRNFITHLFDAYRPRSHEQFEAMLAFAKKHDVATPQTFSNGNNLLHLTVIKGYAPLVEQALAFKPDINHKNGDSLTPLHLAAMKTSNEHLLRLLLNHGADISIRTDFEESAFDLARENELLSAEAVDINFLKLD